MDGKYSKEKQGLGGWGSRKIKVHYLQRREQKKEIVKNTKVIFFNCFFLPIDYGLEIQKENTKNKQKENNNKKTVT